MKTHPAAKPAISVQIAPVKARAGTIKATPDNAKPIRNSSPTGLVM